MDDGNAGMLGLDGSMVFDCASFEDNRAFIALFDPAEQLDQRRLARAILADQGMHLAVVQVELHALQRMDTAVALGNIPHLEDLFTVLCHHRTMLS